MKDMEEAPAAEAERAGDVLDSTSLHELRQLEVDGAEGLVAQLFGSFLNQAGTELAALRSALRSGDVALTGDVSHRLRGTAATLGATGVVRVCEDLEAAAASDHLALYGSLLERLESELVRVARVVDAL